MRNPFPFIGRQIVRPYTQLAGDLTRTAGALGSALHSIKGTIDSHKPKPADDIGARARTIENDQARFNFLAQARGWTQAKLDAAVELKRKRQMAWTGFFLAGLLITGWAATTLSNGGLLELVMALLCASTLILFGVLIAREALWKCQLQTRSLIGWMDFIGRDDFYQRMMPWHR